MIHLRYQKAIKLILRRGCLLISFCSFKYCDFVCFYRVVQIFRRMRSPNVIIINQRNIAKDIALVTEVYISGIMDRMKMTHRHIRA